MSKNLSSTPGSSIKRNLIALGVALALFGLIGAGVIASLQLPATKPTSAVLATPSPSAAPIHIPSADEIYCQEGAAFGVDYSAWGAKWGPKIDVELKRVDARGAAGNLSGWHAAWATLASYYGGSANELCRIAAPAEMNDSVGILVSDLNNLSAIAAQFSKGSFNLWNFNSYVWDSAQGEEEGAVSGMSFRFGFLNGLHSCK